MFFFLFRENLRLHRFSPACRVDIPLLPCYNRFKIYRLQVLL